MLPSLTRAWLGLCLGLGLTGIGLADIGCNPAPAVPCGGRCGPGTECVEDRCQTLVAAEPAPVEAKTRRGRRGKRGKRGGAGEAGAGEGTAGEVVDGPGEEPLPPFVAVDDRKIPEFSAAEPQALDMKAGSERLSEAVLDQHFSRVNPAIVDCVTTASRYGELGSGSLKFKLRILPSGKVESVSVTAPASLRVWGIVPCARKAVFDHRFPGFDGPAIAVNFGVDVD
jgi:hypothetical protein